jgi:hypothetical protein
MYLYREVYRTGMRASELAQWAVKEISEGRELKPAAIVCDHDPLIKEEFEHGAKEAGAEWMRLDLADKKDLMAGIQAVQERFDRAADDRPRIYFVDRALAHEPDRVLIETGRPTSTVEELSAYIWNDKTMKDEPLDKDNHGADAIRYSVRWTNSNCGSNNKEGWYDSAKAYNPSAGLPRGTFRSG